MDSIPQLNSLSTQEPNQSRVSQNDFVSTNPLGSQSLAQDSQVPRTPPPPIHNSTGQNDGVSPNPSSFDWPTPDSGVRLSPNVRTPPETSPQSSSSVNINSNLASMRLDSPFTYDMSDIGAALDIAAHSSPIHDNEIPLPSIETPLVGASSSRNDRAPSVTISRPVTPSRSANHSLNRSGMSAELDAAAESSPVSNSGTPNHLQTPSPMRTRRRRSSSRLAQEPYHVRDEEPPQGHQFHTPAFQGAFNQAKAQVSALAAVLGSGSLHTEPDTTMRRLHARATDLGAFRSPSQRTVGFVGDSGVGKSSLLNSLLDCKDLAIAGSSGAACTCTVTEYLYHDRDEYIIEAELFTRDEIRNQVARSLQDYRHFHLHSREMSDDSERNDNEALANIARDNFEAMFRDRLQDEADLLGDEESLLLRLQSWADELRPSHIEGRTVRSSSTECSDFLQTLTSEPMDTHNPALWPYIRKIRVHLNAHILSRGLILVDLPGLRDVNTARRNITERYLLQCDEIFAVCFIARAVTDLGVKAVFDLASTAELSKVGVVCTRSEDIQANQCINEWPDIADEIRRRRDRVDNLTNELESIQQSLAEYDSEDYEDLLEEERAELSRLNARSRRVANSKAAAEFALHSYLVNTRNDKVTHRLEVTYNETVPGNQLSIFCVSNTDYWENRNRPREEAMLHLQLSGICDLRRHCIALVADSQLRSAKSYILNDIPALLGDLELWVQSGAGTAGSELRRVVRDALDEIQTELQNDLLGIDSPSSGARTSINQSFNSLFQWNTQRWSQGAMDAFQVWNPWHWPTFAAFCRNFGDYCTAAAGSHNWNEEAMAAMVRDLAGPWRRFRAEVHRLQDTSVEDVEQPFEWATTYLDSNLPTSHNTTFVLERALLDRRHLLTTSNEECWSRFESGLIMLQTDVLSGIRTSFFGRAMEQTYIAAGQEYGTGSDKRRKALVGDTLRRERLFLGHIRKFRARLTELVDELQVALSENMTSNLEGLWETFDIVRGENAAREGEENPVFRGQVADALAVARAEMEAIRQVVGSLE